MSRRSLQGSVLALGLLVLPSLARAELSPRSGGYDPHVQVVAYNPMNVVRVVTNTTTSTQLIFSEQEEITNVAIGDSEAWLAQPAGHLLFIKPTELHPATNAQVVTKRPDGSVRSYQLRLISVPRGEGAPMYSVTFNYPAEAARAATLAKVQATAAALEQVSQERLALAWAEGPRNWRYVAQGSKMLEPAEVSDNGRMTAFKFPGNMRVPVIYTLAPDGTEAIVPYTMASADLAVVQSTAREFRLRDGQQVLRIINQGFDPVGRNPGTGTGTPDLTRVVRTAQ